MVVVGLVRPSNVFRSAPATLQAAAAAGVHASAYIFPCPLCSGANGTKQVTDTINFLNNNNAPFDTLWFDIEGAMYWHSAHSANFQFLKDMIRGAENADIDFGIYCNWYTWSSLFGAYSLNNPPKLWYPHYDGKPDFSDFKPFGGFTKPLIKQFSDKGAKCHANGYDINWSPQNI